MGEIRVIATGGNPGFYGWIVMLNMASEREICRMRQGEETCIAADAAIDLGVGWCHGGTPGARLRLMAEPGRYYILRWNGIGLSAEMRVDMDGD